MHTGQHYDKNMSAVFFEELDIPPPAINLEVGSGTHGRQTGAMLEGLERVLMQERPAWTLIYGDTNSTLAGALAAVKLHVPVAHVEAGLRSFERRMPEEINRIVADRLSALLLCPSDTAVSNLAREGITEGVVNVGDVMYDSVLHNVSLAEQRSGILAELGLSRKSFHLATVHRAENTDDRDRLEGILHAFRQIETPIVFPVHPRTRKVLGEALGGMGGSIRVIEAVSYLDMLMLERNARLILTDSGGVQKEAYWLDTPCVTLRDQTEWVELVEAGHNVIVGADTRRILEAVERIDSSGVADPAGGRRDLYGNGHSAETVVQCLARDPKDD